MEIKLPPTQVGEFKKFTNPVGLLRSMCEMTQNPISNPANRNIEFIERIREVSFGIEYEMVISVDKKELFRQIYMFNKANNESHWNFIKDRLAEAILLDMFKVSLHSVEIAKSTKS